MWSLNFWKGTADRAVRTFAQVLLAAITMTGVTVLSLDWVESLSLAGTAAAASILTSIAAPGRPEDDLPYSGKHRAG